MNLKKLILAVAVFLVLLVAAFLFIKPPPLPQIKLPNPNGYDDLVKAGEMFVGERPDCNFNNSDCIEDWKAFFEKNSEALKMVRIGLSRESRVPIDPTNTIRELSLLKLLAQILPAEGMVAEKGNRLDDAITSYLGVIRLSQQMHGGTAVYAPVSLAIESIGMQPLRNVVNTMTAEQRRRVITALTEMYSNRETFDEVMAMDKIWERQSSTLSDKIQSVRFFFSSRDVERKLNLMMKARQTRMGLMLIDLAVRNHETEQGSPPKTLHGLVPKYLPFLPKDNFSGNDFIYRPQSNGFQLYSIGYDGKDDGGKPLSDRTTAAKGDMLNTSPF